MEDDEMKRKNDSFIISFVSAIKHGLIENGVTTKDVKLYAEQTGANVSQAYLNSILPNYSSKTYSKNYPKYFVKENGIYKLSSLGWEEG